MLKSVSSQVDFPGLEEEVLKFWEGDAIFHKTIENRKGADRFVFYEGPPTANGKPGIHHVIVRTYKDLILRYKTMKGYLVERRAGWDTHGLPVEIQVEKELGLKGKQDILALKDNEFDSIEYFNQKCKESVFRYVDEWVSLTKRIGFWLDFDKAYVTYDNNYIESVWWFIKEVDKRGFLYKDYKVVPYCPRCGTSLSSHELAQGYKDDVEDPSVYLKFELVDEPGTFLLVWTTTPWTLPGNVALAVNPEATYVKREVDGMKVIHAEQIPAKNLGISEESEVLESFKGEKLVGKKYHPLFETFKGEEKAYTVYSADFVSLEDGTGIVHTAVMYGVEDFNLGKKLGLPMKHTVTLKGELADFTGPFAGMFVKKADKYIIKDLEDRGLMFKATTTRHTYPFCWRCSTPILYYALDSWFIKTTAVRDELIKNNQKINWVPKTIQKGRMGNWLETLIDWNISRNRFWGTPLPVWECKNGHYQVIGGKAEVEKLGGKVPNDLHRPFIDNVKFDCPDCQTEMVRSSDVMDVWMDSGAMPFAQWHYPFENQEIFKQWYPADYIVEAIDQTRGWFFTLMAEAILLGNDAPAPFKNVLTTGHILDENNLKMSKSKGNIVDPFEIIPEIGADAIRWYMCTAASAGESFPFSANLVKEKQRKFSLILWNSYKFFVDYANVTGWTCELQRGELTILDKWILAKFTELVKFVNKSLDEYDLIRSSRAIEEFVVNDFSTWYIRRSRDRVSLLAEESDRNTCLSVMYGVLVGLSKLLAPFMPFMSEEMYRNLTDDNSVHLTDYPKGDDSLLDDQLVADMVIVRSVVEKGHSKRKESNIKLRQPLAKVIYQAENKLSEELEQIIAEELNVKAVEFSKKSEEPEVELDTEITLELAEEGEARELIRNIQKLRKEQNMVLNDQIEVVVPHVPAKFEEMIKKQTNTVAFKTGESLEIRKLEV